MLTSLNTLMKNPSNKYNLHLITTNYTNLILNLKYITKTYSTISLMMNGKVLFKIFLFKKLQALLKQTMNILNMWALLAKFHLNYLLTNVFNFKKFHLIGKHLTFFLSQKNPHGTLHLTKFAQSQLLNQ